MATDKRRRFYRHPKGRTYHRSRDCSYLRGAVARNEEVSFLAPDPGAGVNLVHNGRDLNDCPRCGA